MTLTLPSPLRSAAVQMKPGNPQLFSDLAFLRPFSPIKEKCMSDRLLSLFGGALQGGGIAALICSLTLTAIQPALATNEAGKGDCKSTSIKCSQNTCTGTGCNSPSDCLCT